MDREQHPGEPGRALDQVDVDDLRAHVAGEGEGRGTEGGGRRPERLAPQEQVRPGERHVVDEGEVDRPRGRRGRIAISQVAG